ncbi:MAG: alpha/beta fold hydrolase [Candidatus Hodarchaeota archaeon]
MVKFEKGYFEDTVPYLKAGSGDKNMVIIQGSLALIIELGLSAGSEVKRARKLIPEDYTFYIIGFERNLPENTTLERLATKYARIIRKNIGKTSLMGRSYGGLVALAIAALYPRWVEKLFLICSAANVSDPGRNFVNRVLDAFKTDDYSKMVKVLSGLFVSRVQRAIVTFGLKILKSRLMKIMYPTSTMVTAYEDLLNRTHDWGHILKLVKAPTCIVGGTKDAIFTVEDFQKTAQDIPNANLILLEGAGHMFETVSQREMREKLQDYL